MSFEKKTLATIVQYEHLSDHDTINSFTHYYIIIKRYLPDIRLHDTVEL